MNRVTRKEFLRMMGVVFVSGVLPTNTSAHPVGNLSSSKLSLHSSILDRGDVKVRISRAYAIIENVFVRVEYDLTHGVYRAINRMENLQGFTRASSRTNDLLSSDPGLHRSVEVVSRHDALGEGKALLVRSHRKDGMTQILEIALYPNKPFIALTSGVINNTGLPIHLMEMRPITQAALFPHARSWDAAKTLDGVSGGGENRVMEGRARQSVNNLLLTFLDDGKRCSLVAGGLTYHDYVKYIHLGTPHFAREEDIQKSLPSNQYLVAYMDCGEYPQIIPMEKSAISVLQGETFTFSGAENVADPAFGSVLFDPQAVILQISGLHQGESYRFGWSWWDYDNDGRVESVIAESPDGSRKATLIERYALPAWERQQEKPELMYADIPAECVKDGKLRILVTNDVNVPNAVISEAWLIAASEKSVYPSVGKEETPLDLIASDPVGRLVNPGEKYLPEDRFYVDFITRNPFESLEKYGLAVRMAQGAHPNLYDFPTVCAWYVEVYDHGPKINNTAGLVEEMDRVKRSGFLKYSPVALRLVPDTYTPDNEQGWWDDVHWRKYGHYTAPYETSAKWGKAITSRGGLPFIYVQTCLVSGDYLKTHPECLLFKSTAGAEKRYQMNAWQYAYDLDLPNYDYTSKAFRDHLLQSWSHLREGGVQGVMFDYPESAWRPKGGFEDKRATCAYAYRSPFRICREGLGPHAWIHERNIGDGADVPLSDMTAGLVDSQRVWGDNSVFQPGMVTKCALRWYKYRTLYSYDMDAKSLFAQANPDREPLSRTRIRALLTMLYVTAGRVLLANSFRDLTREMLHDLSRLYPVQKGTHTARPADVFTGVPCPRIFIDKFMEDWSMEILFNPDFDHSVTLEVPLSGDQVNGALGLNPQDEYYLYDFWNDRLAGKLSGRDKLVQTLEPGEARVLSVHKVTPFPQVISTNRHITQGWVDLTRKPVLDNKRRQLSGVSSAASGEPCKIVIAKNGYDAKGVRVEKGVVAHLEPVQGNPSLARVEIDSNVNGNVWWTVEF